jgi:hypothetical protein
VYVQEFEKNLKNNNFQDKYNIKQVLQISTEVQYFFNEKLIDFKDLS